ncbi:MAG: hypothetical protein Q9M94_03790 [Candidatus Gracilibacteria bacterium]|nr:hypothetical protein [Candidatus Gracilibacteria bacterium]
MKKILLSVLLITFLVSCGNNKEDENIDIENIGIIKVIDGKKVRVLTLEEYSKIPKKSKEYEDFMDKFTDVGFLIFKNTKCTDLKEEETITRCRELEKELKDILSKKECVEFSKEEEREFCKLNK